MAVRTLGGRLRAILLVCAGLGLLALLLWTLAAHWRPSATRYILQGVDVSEAQGTIEWPTVRAAGADFAYVRATAGAERRDAQFAANWTGVDAAGLRRGALHDWSFCASATDQANIFNTTVPRTANALPAAVAIDLDDGCATPPPHDAAIAALKQFLTMVESHTETPVLLKVSRRAERAYGITEAIPRPVWSVGRFLPPDYAARPWRMWQANVRRIDGVDRPVDWDVVAP